MIQYNAALVITGANQIYRGLGLEFLADWRWFQKIFLSQNIQWSFTCMLHVYSYCGEGVYQTGSTNQENLQLSTIKHLSHLFFLIVLKNGIILVRNSAKFNLKSKRPVSSDSKKT